jgi:hypothetical protein
LANTTPSPDIVSQVIIETDISRPNADTSPMPVIRFARKTGERQIESIRERLLGSDD